MASRSLVWVCLAVASVAAMPFVLWSDGPIAGKSVSEPEVPRAPAARAMIQQYCIACHNAEIKTAGLVLDVNGLDRMGEHPDLWEKVARKLRTGEMPPAG